MQPRDGLPDPSSNLPASEAGRPLRRRFTVPLKPTVLVVFVAMTVPVLLGIVRANYVSSDRVARDYAANLVERFGREAIRDIENNFAALGSLIATAAELGRQDPKIFEDDRALAYLFRILQHSDTVLNVYVGLDDGSFRQARRIHDPKVPIHGAPPPEGAEFAYRLVEPALGLAGAGPLHLPRLQPEPPGRSRRGERLRSARPAVVRRGRSPPVPPRSRIPKSSGPSAWSASPWQHHLRAATG